MSSAVRDGVAAERSAFVGMLKRMMPAAATGVPAGDWAQALAGWNQRIQAYPAVAQRFNTLYRAG